MMGVSSKPVLRSGRTGATSSRQPLEPIAPKPIPNNPNPPLHLPLAQTTRVKRTRSALDNDEENLNEKKRRTPDTKDSLEAAVHGRSRPVNVLASLPNSTPHAALQTNPLRAGSLRIRLRKPDSVDVNGESDKRRLNARGHGRTNVVRSNDDAQRRLRSQDGGSRFKSELALFFPNYDNVLNGEQSEPDFLGVNTPILVIDEDERSRANIAPILQLRPSKCVTTPPQACQDHNHHACSLSPEVARSFLATRATLGARPCNVQKLDFSSIEKGAGSIPEDPLPDSVYFNAHRRAERREKQLRNIEKNKAQHEKDNLERLLEGLKGPDWLRVMGVSGITDGEKKEYEPKRDFFIREVAALLEKFKAWKEEEKRRRLEREEAERVKAEADEGESTNEELESPEESGDVDHESEDSHHPDQTDLDASAARQLHQEAILATGARTMPGRQSKFSRAKPDDNVDALNKPFTSFYAKPYQRAAAVGNVRRSGRTATAFGQPIPEIAECEFKLPEGILTTEAIIARARTRRRLRRGSKST